MNLVMRRWAGLAPKHLGFTVDIQFWQLKGKARSLGGEASVSCCPGLGGQGHAAARGGQSRADLNRYFPQEN